MKIHIVLLGLICAVCGDIQAQNYAQYVRPLIGTDIRIVQGKQKALLKNAVRLYLLRAFLIQ